MKSITRALILVLLAAPIASAQTTAAPPPGPDEAGRWRAVARAVTLGSKVKVETFERRKYTGTLMDVSDTAIMIKRSTRMPEPAITVPFDQVSRIEQDRGGLNVAKAVGIGIAAGAGAILTLFALAFALSD